MSILPTDVEANIKVIQKIDWNKISVRQKLSEGFIKEFKDKINWKFISGCQTLTEAFIKEFQDKDSWYKISFHQELTESFIIQDRLNNSDSEYSDSNLESD